MSFNTGEDPELVPEYIPTNERFKVSVSLKRFADIITRMSALALENSAVEGADLTKIESFKPSGGTAGFLKLSASNGSVGHEVIFYEVEVFAEDEILVETKKLQSIMKMAETDKITLTATGFELKVTSGTAMWKLKMPPRASIPRFEGVSSTPEEFDTQEAIYALTTTLKGVARSHSRASLTQIKFSQGNFTSCNGVELYRVTAPSFDDVEDFTISTLGAKAVLLALIKNSEEVTSLHITENVLTFKVGNETLVISRSKLPYPEVEKVFISQSVLNDTAVTINPKDLEDAVKSVKVFADQALAAVSITSVRVKDDQYRLLVQANDEIGNSSHTSISCSFVGKDPVNLNLNYKNILSVLSCCKDSLIVLRVGKNSKTSKTTALFEDQAQGFIAVVGQTLKGQ